MADVKIEQGTFYGFPDCVRLNNGKVVLTIAPNVGRIVGYHRVGEKNLIWLNPEPIVPEKLKATEWANYGGDKVWPTAQFLWPQAMGRAWPPDRALDGKSFTLRRLKSGKVKLIGPVSRHLGVRVIRQISLSPDSTRVVIDNTLERKEAVDFPVHIWTVTQCLQPKYALLDLAPDRAEPKRRALKMDGKGLTKFIQDVGDEQAVRFDPYMPTHGKVGTYGRWVAGVYEKRCFVQTCRYDPKACYLDRANCEIYTNKPSQRYLELELLSPAAAIRPGEKTSFRVTWHILPLTKTDDPEKIVNRIRLISSSSDR